MCQNNGQARNHIVEAVVKRSALERTPIVMMDTVFGTARLRYHASRNEFVGVRRLVHLTHPPAVETCYLRRMRHGGYQGQPLPGLSSVRAPSHHAARVLMRLVRSFG